jgi:hypothetical protein
MVHGRMMTKRVVGPATEYATEKKSPGPHAGGSTPYLEAALFLAIAPAMALMIVMYSGNAWWFYALVVLGCGAEGALLHRILSQPGSQRS